MSKAAVILVCKRVIFYELKDEEAFFGWVSKIKCITKQQFEGDTISLRVKSLQITEQDLRDLLALFFRYKVNMAQLAVFLNDQNKAWFFEMPKMYWHKKVFKK